KDLRLQQNLMRQPGIHEKRFLDRLPSRFRDRNSVAPARLLRRHFLCGAPQKSGSLNPKGIPASSLRLRRRRAEAALWRAAKAEGTTCFECPNPMDHNPNGVASPCISHRTKPRWGLIGSAWLTQGSCATLGGRTKSLRDFSAA